MDVTLIEVLIWLARKWSLHHRRKERGDPIWRKRCEALDDRIEYETSPIPKLQLLQERIGVEETWSELWDSESYYNVALGKAVEWCAAHTGFGGRLIFDLAVAGFEASALKPELQSEAQKLSPALLSLPADIWRTTGWAKLVLSAQPKSDTSGRNGNADSGANSTLAPKAEMTEATADDELREPQDCEKAAYYAFRYAEMKQQRKLRAQEAHEFWTEYGFDSADRDTDNADVLMGYEIPALPTFRSQLSRARNAFNDLRNEDRTGRRGRSVVERGDLD